MKEFTMFQIYKEPDGYCIYYDFIKEKIYGCYNVNEEIKPNYNILLIQPFIILGVKSLNKWIEQFGIWSRYLVCALLVLLVTFCINIFYEKLLQQAEKIQNRRLQELSEPSEEEWAEYIQWLEEQLKKQIHLYIWLGLGSIVSIALFLWNGFILFLLLYIIFYLILKPFIAVGCPIRKYRFIKAGKRKLQQ